MAYTKIVDEGNRRDDNELLTYNSALTLIKEIESESYFYETEPAEVLFVYTDISHPNFPKVNGNPDLTFLGGIRARLIYSEQGSNIDHCKNYKPLNPNIMNYPIVGELVVAVSYGDDDDDTNFYISTINFDGSPSNNEKFGASVGGLSDTLLSIKFTTPNIDSTERNQGYYYKDFRTPKLIPNEGDTIIEGRFGNSIRIGSDQINNNASLSSKIHITTGRNNNIEDVDIDASTILLSENIEPQYTVSYIPKVEKFTQKPSSEIFINSDQIILNSKNRGNIGILSSGNISLGALGDTVIEIPSSGNIKLGGVDADEPVVRGNQLDSILKSILTALENFATKPILNPGTLPGNASVLFGELTKIRLKLTDLNSRQVKTI